MWSTPFWASSSTARIAIDFQNELCDSPSTIRPNARSLSATHALRAPSRGGALRVIARENNEHEIRHRVPRFPFAQMLEHDVGFHHVWDRHRPAWIFADQNAVERRNVRPRVVLPGHGCPEVGGVVGLRLPVLGEQ